MEGMSLRGRSPWHRPPGQVWFSPKAISDAEEIALPPTNKIGGSQRQLTIKFAVEKKIISHEKISLYLIGISFLNFLRSCKNSSSRSHNFCPILST